MGTEDQKFGLKIGEVAEATGISVFRLRQWERRYHSPRSKKLASGHRRYDIGEVVRLRLIKRVVEMGFRANHVVPMTVSQLEQILWDSTDGLKGSETWMTHVLAYDARALVVDFEKNWNEMGPVGFIAEKLAPFIVGVGRAWEEKKIDEIHEHFFSEVVENFLSSKWFQQKSDGHRWVLAALSDEYHALGMQMAATILVQHQKEVIYIGRSTPLEQLIEMVRQQHAEALALSISRNYDPEKSRKLINKARKQLPADIRIVIGGSGAPTGIEAVERFTDLRVFDDWLRLSHPR